jgi:hypothetical protein
MYHLVNDRAADNRSQGEAPFRTIAAYSVRVGGGCEHQATREQRLEDLRRFTHTAVEQSAPVGQILPQPNFDCLSASVDRSKPAISAVGRDGVSVLSNALVQTQVGVHLGPPAAGPALEHMGVVQQPIEQGADRRRVTQ